MDTTTTTTETATEVATAEATATATEKETSLDDEIRYIAYDVSHIEKSVDERETLYDGYIEDKLEALFDLKKKTEKHSPEWRRVRRLIGRLVACAAEVSHL